MLHAAILAAVAWPPAPHQNADAGAAGQTRTATIVVPPPEDAAFRGLKPVDRKPDPRLDRKYSPLSLKNSTFDLDAIASHARVLFPFVSPGVLLELFQLRPDDNLQWLQTIAASRAGSARRERPLRLSPSQIQELVDRTWSRRTRWAAVQPMLALSDARDANEGALPALLRGYAEQNMGQYFQDRNLLAANLRLWAELSVAADHVTFIGYIRRYAADHPSTRATTELLFLLDKIADSNRNVLHTLLSFDPEWLYDTQAADPHAYELAVALKTYYGGLLRSRDLDADGTDALYDAARLQILEGILRTTPLNYRASDARFLIGAIHWRSGRLDAALASWCAMAIDDSDAYVGTYRQVLDVLRAAGPRACTASDAGLTGHRAIDRILKQDAEDAWTFQFHRLWTFGYQFDRF